MSKEVITVVLAAGEGKRMGSSIPKAMHLLGGYPMLFHSIKSSSGIGSKSTVVVVSEEMSSYKDQIINNKFCDKTEVAVQKERLGTAHAVLAAKEKIKNTEGVLLVQYADTPMVSEETLSQLISVVDSNEAAVSLLAFNEENKNSYGKLVTEGSFIKQIIEDKDSNESQKKIPLCNSGVMAISLKHAWEILESIDNKNAQGEYYLTDAIKIANSMGLKCKYIEEDKSNLLGANNKLELSQLEEHFQNKTREQFLLKGVQLINPSSVFFSLDTQISKGVMIYPNVYFFPNVVVEENATIFPFCTIEGAKIESNVNLGPFARIREGTEIKENAKIGNFVEVKKAVIGSSSKVNHLSYVGDTEMGEKVNIGAGVITCNYDGKKKHKTNIGNNSFIGSNSSLIAPVDIGDNVTVAAGSTITRKIEDNSLGVAREKQKNISNWHSKTRS